LSFDARAGAITSIIGPNGAGKTTALNAICGFYRPDAGMVKLGEQTVSELRAHQIPRVGIARTYQTSRLFESLSVIDNVLIALRRGKLGAASFFASQHDEASAAVAEGLLAFVGYRGAIDVPAGALAHVDKRLVEIARALALRPAILALDEPAAGLDAADTALIDKVLRELAAIGIAIILVEHDMELVMGVSSRVIVLDAGAKIAEGAPHEIAASPAVREAYLGAGGQAERGRQRTLPARDASLLTVRSLSAGYGAATVVRDAALEVRGHPVAVDHDGFAAGRIVLDAIEADDQRMHMRHVAEVAMRRQGMAREADVLAAGNDLDRDEGLGADIVTDRPDRGRIEAPEQERCDGASYGTCGAHDPP
jgi:ABC-type branched-subunit amino acid transport system ATPase component